MFSQFPSGKGITYELFFVKKIINDSCTAYKVAVVVYLHMGGGEKLR